MNYTEYNNQLKLPDDLYKKTLAGVKSEISNDEALNLELWIQKQPALVIIEESIDFKDMIFEWIVPEITDLKWMLISIVWGWDSCWTWGCGTCSSALGCWDSCGI